MKPSVVAASCSIVLLLAACGSDSSASEGDSTTPATATTSTVAPVPTSLPTAATTSSGTATTMATTDATDRTTPPTNSTEATETTGSTASTASTASTDSTDSPDNTMGSAITDSTGTDGSGNEYISVVSPVVPASTRLVSADDNHPDGVYYASVSEDGDAAPAASSVVFELVQLFTGPACMAHFGEDDEDACVNDYGVETDPTSKVEVALDDQFISVVDAASQQSYQISGAELYKLLLGDLPSAGSPVDYQYSAFGFLVTYHGGEVTRLEQWWTP